MPPDKQPANRACTRIPKGVHVEIRKLEYPIASRNAETATSRKIAQHGICLLDYFLLPRERLLEIVSASGRTPNVSDGGALETTVSNQDYGYPQLWVVQEGVDYTRFDRFHVNVAEDGTGVDEVLQMVSGEGVVVRVQQSSGMTHNLRLDCPASDVCWMISYDAGQSHVGSLSSATPGTKLVVQAFGPSEWALRYTDGDD